jgi:hypothetical protein
MLQTALECHGMYIYESWYTDVRSIAVKRCGAVGNACR